MIIEVKDEKYKRMRCFAIYKSLLSIRAEGTYVEMYTYVSEDCLNFCYLTNRICFGVKNVSLAMLRERMHVPCSLYVYADDELQLTATCYLAEFKKERSGINKGGYRLEFQRLEHNYDIRTSRRYNQAICSAESRQSIHDSCTR